MDGESIDILSLISGVVMTIGGLCLTVFGFFVWPALIYGIPILIIGVYILFTLKDQEKVEAIMEKDIKKKVLKKG
jgi:hypothetical protein